METLEQVLEAAAAEFHHPDALSQWRAKIIVEECVAEMLGRPKTEPTASMRLGSLVHCILLEPDDVLLRYYPGEKVDRRTKVGKARWAEMEAEAGSREIVDIETFAAAQMMAAKVRHHPACGHWLGLDGRSEIKVGWVDDETGCRGKAIIDRVAFSEGMMLEVKTTGASPGMESFQREIGQRKYHLQAAMYMDGCNTILAAAGLPEIEDFGYVVVETTPPYEAAGYILDHSAIERGRGLYTEAFRRWGSYLRDRDGWHGYPIGVTIGVPKWA